jgi:outer membrane protein TolC
VNTLLASTSTMRRGPHVRASRRLCFFPHWALVGVAGILATGCMTAPAPRIAGAPAAPVSASEPWRAPRGVVPPEPRPAPAPAFPADIAPHADALGLDDVVDLALRNNPQTQLSWAQARAGAATYGAATGAYYPTLDASLNAGYSKTSVNSTAGGSGERATIAPIVNLSYLLFDFGGRSGSVAAARAAAVALDLTHNATLQNVALQVEGAFFNFQAQRGLVAAFQLNLATADTNLASARERNRAGVATIADVLQAETLRAQAQLDLETALFNFQSGRAALAVAMGLPANTPYDVAATTDSIPVALAAVNVDTLINRALENRPDLAAARVGILEAQSLVRVARSAELPSVTLGASANQPFSNQNTFTGRTYSLSLGIGIPIFNLARPYNVQAAQARVDAATAQTALLRTLVSQQVYTSYYALQTSTQRVRTTEVLIRSATASEAAARARYRAGVGTILDLITAQSALASARAQQAQSRWIWATALSQLAHDVGVLGPRGETPIPLTGNAPGVLR